MTRPCYWKFRLMRLKWVLQYFLTLTLTAWLISKEGKCMRIMNHRFNLKIINRLFPRGTCNTNKSSSLTNSWIIKYVSSTLVFITCCGKNLCRKKGKKIKFSLDEVINSKEQKFRNLHKHVLKALNFVALAEGYGNRNKRRYVWL